jgi:hypothetical protein|tara:strand:- start:158 stop:355 length:198 start_codon:yes stop_codon:yes gene_type:complete
MDYRGGYLELLAECSDLNAKNKMLLAALRDALKLLSVYREDHACTDENCEECEIVLAAENALGGA